MVNFRTIIKTYTHSSEHNSKVVLVIIIDPLVSSTLYQTGLTTDLCSDVIVRQAWML